MVKHPQSKPSDSLSSRISLSSLGISISCPALFPVE